VAIVAVDALGNFNPLVIYTGIYILEPQVVSRELSLFIGAEPQPPYRQVVSREISIVVTTPAPPPAVTNLTTAHSPINDSVTLNWNGYNQWAVGDVARYDIYFSDQAFSNVSEMTRYASVPGETFSITLNGLTPWQDHFVAVVAVDAVDAAPQAASARASAPRSAPRRRGNASCRWTDAIASSFGPEAPLSSASFDTKRRACIRQLHPAVSLSPLAARRPCILEKSGPRADGSHRPSRSGRNHTWSSHFRAARSPAPAPAC
jgi:hypothetical protein